MGQQGHTVLLLLRIHTVCCRQFFGTFLFITQDRVLCTGLIEKSGGTLSGPALLLPLRFLYLRCF